VGSRRSGKAYIFLCFGGFSPGFSAVATSRCGAYPPTKGIQEGIPPVLGNEVQNGVTYDMPSFKTMDRDGNVMVNIRDDAMAPQE